MAILCEGAWCGHPPQVKESGVAILLHKESEGGVAILYKAFSTELWRVVWPFNVNASGLCKYSNVLILKESGAAILLNRDPPLLK